MNVDLILAAVKFGGILVVGVIGILALIVEYKDDKNKITKWGRRALFLTIISVSLSIVAHSLEFYKSQKESEKRQLALKKEVEFNQKLLSEIHRNLHSFESITTSLFLRFSLPKEHAARYLERLDKLAKSFIQSGYDDKSGLSVAGSVLDSESGDIEEVTDVRIHKCTTGFPSHDKERILHLLMSYISIDFVIFKEPWDAKLQPNIEGDFLTQPDIKYSISYHPDNFEYSLENQNFLIQITKIEPRRLTTSGNIIGTSDLSGAQLMFRIRGMITEDDKINKILQELRESIDVTFIILNLSNGRKITIKRDRIEKLKLDGGSFSDKLYHKVIFDEL